MAKMDIPILIAGGGPVGLTFAVELGLRGIPCVLVEKRDGKLTVPRMSQVSTRGMEFCRRWGIAEKVRSAVWTNTHTLDFVYLTSLVGEEIARLKVPSYQERGPLDYTPEGPCHCPQIYFDPILAELAKTFPSVTIRYNTALQGFEQGDDIVQATLVDSLNGKSETLTARYLIGCDGPGGVVRESLGIELDGMGTLANSVNIFFRSPDLATLHDKGWARFYRCIDEEGSWGEMIAIDGRELWRLTVFDHRDGDVDAGAYLARLAGCDFPYEIISVLTWDRRDFCAKNLRKGNVFIAGDAAHEVSPTGGLGMHTGCNEAVNLSWKLAALIQGWGGPRLVESYEAECMPVAAYNVDISTQSFHNITGLPPSGAVREVFADDGSPARDALLRSLTIPDFYKVQITYENSPICVPDGTAFEPDDMKNAKQSARPGSRAPHGWVAQNETIFDRLGPDFTLLRFGAADSDVESVVGAAAECGLPLSVCDIVDDHLAALYEKRLVLVRPDGHVSWRGDAAPADVASMIDAVRGAG
ncbi:FAD-dependent monooxygenase [Alphaproteobacteria bacterium]|nr:FAD-dependent monooxygenase [Alphaproteobacteria bacterium]